MNFGDLGKLVLTKAVADLRGDNHAFYSFINTCLSRYLNNDWGDLPPEDKNLNDDAVKSGEDRILASYSFPSDKSWNAINSFGGCENKIWIITEWDRSVTTILFPSEY